MDLTDILLTGIIFICITVQLLLSKKYRNSDNKKEYLLATVTHDLKTPTNAQISMLNMLLKGQFGKLTPEQYDAIKLTCNSSRYISSLIGTIMTRYECYSCNLKLNCEYFNIVELINFICCQNEYLASDKSQKIVFNSNTIDCEIYADKLQISRVITNLLSNAVSYGLKKTSIILNLISYPDHIDFSVTNTGYPLNSNEIKKAFNKFWRNKKTKDMAPGSGLGLYVSKQIIDLHKGNIYAHNSNDGIFTFGFTLKIIQKPEIEEVKLSA